MANHLSGIGTGERRRRGKGLYLVVGVWGGGRGPGLRVCGQRSLPSLEAPAGGTASSCWEGISLWWRRGQNSVDGNPTDSWGLTAQLLGVSPGVQCSRAADPLVPPGGGRRCCSRNRERRRVGSAAELTAEGASIPPGPIIWVPQAWPPLSAAQQ